MAQHDPEESEDNGKKKKKRKIMRSLKINEISAVDRPAQQGAKVVMMKRDTKNTGGDPTPRGTNKSAGLSGGGQQTHVEDLQMTDAEKAAAEKAEATEKARVEKLESDLKTTKLYAGLNDVQKAHYNELDEKAKTDFLGKSEKDREVVITKAAEADQVIYTDSEGNDYRKSDDPRTVSLAKRADAAIKVAQAAEDRADAADLEKRTEETLKHLPGDKVAKMAVLKAVEGIKDEDTRTKALEMLKVNGEKLAEAFVNKGTKEVKLNKAEDELEVLAKKHSADHKVDIVQARVAVLSTPEGSKLYHETLSTPVA